MQLWEELLRINGLTLRHMHHAKDIRANLHMWTVSYSGRNSFFSLYFWYEKNGCYLPERMHLVTLGGKLAFSGGHQSSFKTPWDSSAMSFCGELLWEPSMSAWFGRCYIIQLHTLSTGKWHYLSGTV